MWPNHGKWPVSNSVIAPIDKRVQRKLLRVAEAKGKDSVAKAEAEAACKHTPKAQFGKN